MLAMTAPLVSRSTQQDRNRLFLVKSEKKDAVTLIAEATLSHALKPFIKSSNARIAVWTRPHPSGPGSSPSSDGFQVLQIEVRRLGTENAALLKRILEAETEVDRQRRHNARLVAEREEVQSQNADAKGPDGPNLRKWPTIDHSAVALIWFRFRSVTLCGRLL
ncbi:hypothetical protein [Mesorhizobium sp. AA22]|uniref:hypothetical protein n=2 Tax=Mesorhizobium TaxID=68287 RepID=UPI001FEE0470|nr:hypothetical protein [Mesorhizobium sp. AA22]